MNNGCACVWPVQTREKLEEELEWWDDNFVIVIVADVGDGMLIGYAEASSHHEAPGCTTNRIGFLEGWYVEPVHPSHGIGRALDAAAEQWACEHSCTEMASDTYEDYPIGPAVHGYVNNRQIERTLNFAKLFASLRGLIFRI